MKRIFALAALPLYFVSTGSAYYYYTQYSGRSAPFIPIVQKFDLTALTNKTVPVLISDQGPSAMVPGDSYLAVVSEIRAAASVWNDVTTSDIRLTYSGLFTVGAQVNSPAIEVSFSDDIPPGLLALSGPEVLGGISQSPSGGSFIPIQRSKVLLKRDLSQNPPLPSYGELMFTTLVHEFGHALGLQHTLTSSVMSTATTSSATRAMPLGPDDIAAISLLYPAAGYAATVGSVSGRVTLGNGTGVNLASVVAISTSGGAISALTNPDGTYEIDGLLPQQYYIYVHALPSPLLGESYPANITPPVDQRGAVFPVGPAFTTQFYPGTRDFNQAQWVFVYAGNITGNVNFSVAQRTTPAIASVRLYGYTSVGTAVTAPQLFVGIPSTLVAYAPTGLLQNGFLASGLSIGMMGTAATIYDERPYYQQFVAFDVSVNLTTGPGPKHVLFSSPNDLYVAPSAFTVAQNPPPAITALAPGSDNNGNRVVTISGSNLQPDTRYYFDGLPGTVQGVTTDGRVVVTPPPAPGGYTATVVALNTSDAQSSLFLQAPTPPTYTYDSAPSPALAIAPQYLTPGIDTQVDVVSSGAAFVDGQVAAGFGTSDVTIKKIAVLSPTHIVITATAPNGSFIPTSSINVTIGLRVMSTSFGTSIGPQVQ